MEITKSSRCKKIVSIILVLSFLLCNAETGVKNSKDKIKAATIGSETEWNIRTINAENSYNESKNYKKIKVAVLDSGLDYDKNIPFVERKDFLHDGNESYLYQDMTGHGTSVCSIICAAKNEDRITGIAANVDLYVARILDEKNQAPVDRVIEAVNWAIEKKVNIIHMSFGTKDYSEALENVINKAYNKGILIVAAAGNNGKALEDRSTIEYPGVFDNVITVGATDKLNGMTKSSSTGKELDVVAPGDKVLADGAFEGVVVESGSSISAAHVTGMAAVLWGKYPEQSNEFIRKLLIGTANENAVKDEECGNGLVDLKYAEKSYDKMVDAYKSNIKKGMGESKAIRNAEKSLKKNNSIVEKHNEVNYINGSWDASGHRDFVDKNTKKLGKYYQITRLAAVMPDKIKEMKYLGKNKYYHGGGNYFTNSHYLFVKALKLYKGSNKKIGKGELNKYGTKISEGFSGVKNKTNKNLLKELFKECGATTKEQKGYALLGVALHNMTDAFTHNVEKEYKVGNYSYYIKVIHDEKNAPRALKWLKNTDSKYSKSVNANYRNLYNNYAIADKRKKLSGMYDRASTAAKYLISDFNNLKSKKKGKVKWLKKVDIESDKGIRLSGAKEKLKKTIKLKKTKKSKNKKNTKKKGISIPRIVFKVEKDSISIQLPKNKKNIWIDILNKAAKKNSLIGKTKIKYVKDNKSSKKTVKDHIKYKRKEVINDNLNKT